MFNYPFERLEAWQLSRKFVVKIYNLTDSFPPKERFGLTSQLRRAAVSVSSNLAEGTGRWTQKDQAHFYSIAYSSLMEVLNQLIISGDLNWVESESLNTIRQEIERLSNKIYSLRKSTINKG